MKTTNYLTILFCFLYLPAKAQLDTNDFVTTWDTRNDPCFFCSISTVYIFADRSSYTYNFDIDWNNDGIFDTLGVTASIQHTYSSPGIYTIRIRGNFPSLKFGGYTFANGNRSQINTANPFPNRLISVDQWGNQEWKDLEWAFANCQELTINATDQPKLDSIKSLYGTFYNAIKMNDSLNGWDVSNVEDMAYLFFSVSELASFNQPLDQWNVSKVKSMEGMFKRTAFDQDISNWDVSSVESMAFMFSDTSKFNQDISTWNVSNVRNTEGMFSNNRSFNQDLSNWNISNDTNLHSMFKNARSFDQNLSAWTFHPNAILDSLLSYAGISASNYDSTLIAWAGKPSMQNLNLGADYLMYCAGKTARDSLLARGWNISGDVLNCDTTQMIVTFHTEDMIGPLDSSIELFVNNNYPANFDVDWNNDGIFDSLSVTGSITHKYPKPGVYTIAIRGVFPSPKFGTNFYSKSLMLAFHQWGNTQLKNLDRTFSYCREYRAIDDPILDSVTSADELFYNAEINGDISNWDVSSIRSMHAMFYGVRGFNQDIGAWDVSNVQDMSQMFVFNFLFNQDIGAWDVSNVQDMSQMFIACYSFNQDLSLWDVSNVTNMGGMFYNTGFNSPLANWNVSNVTNMVRMFSGAGNFNQDISLWDVSSVTNMGFMFLSAGNFNQPLNSWDVSAVTDMQWMFAGASSFNQNLNSWDVSNVTNMSRMFMGANSFNESINNWDLSSLITMELMFSNTQSFNRPLNNWDVSNVTNMNAVFWDARSFNQPLNQWNVSNVTDMGLMFYEAHSFDQNLGQWDINSLGGPSSLQDFFSYSGMSTSNYDSTLIGWESSNYPSNIIMGAEGLEYCLADSARNNLIANGWVFVGDTIDTACVITNIKDSDKQINRLTEFRVYPNPADGVMYVESGEEIKSLEIYSVEGRLIWELETGNWNRESKSWSIEVGNFENGIYLLRIFTEEGEKSERIVFQH